MFNSKYCWKFFINREKKLEDKPFLQKYYSKIVVLLIFYNTYENKQNIEKDENLKKNNTQ